MKTRVLLVLIFAASTLAGQKPDANRSTSLGALIERVERDLPGLHARLARAESRELAARAMPRWYVPELRAELGGGGASNGNEAVVGPLGRVVASWTFWDGGRRAGRGAVRGLRAHIAREEARLYRYDLRLQLARDYYRLAEIAALKRVNAAERDRLRRLKNSLYPRIRIGSVGYSALTDVELRRGAILDANAALDGEARRIRERLSILMGSDPGRAARNERKLSEATAITRLVLPSVPDGEMDLEYLPHVRLARLRARLGRSAAKLARRNLYWPSIGLDVFGGYQPFRDAIDPARPEAGALLTIRLPLFGSASRSAALDSVRLAGDADALQLEQILRESRARSGALRSVLNESLERAGRLDGLARRARANLARAFGEFAGDLRSASDMRDGTRTLADLERARVGQLRRAHLARFEWDLPATLGETPRANSFQDDAGGSDRREQTKELQSIQSGEPQ